MGKEEIVLNIFMHFSYENIVLDLEKNSKNSKTCLNSSSTLAL